jgi:phosphoribosylaminoimidazole-succinocarboxamide synthase
MQTLSPADAAATLVADGKSKQLFSIPDAPDQVRAVFKDQLTAFNAQKVSQLAGKGALNAHISAKLFSILEHAGLPTCFIAEGPEANTLVYRKLTMIPLEVIVRNQAYGSIIKRLGWLQPGQSFARPWVEYCYKNDGLGDPPLPTELIEQQGWLPEGVSVEGMTQAALAVNDVVRTVFASVGINVADFKLEFGIDPQGQLRVADELSPDNFRLRDMGNGQVLDKDVFRLELGDVGAAYQAVWQRLQALQPTEVWPACATAQTYNVVVNVQNRPNVLHPESRTILTALQTLGLQPIDTLQAGKRFELTITAHHLADAQAQVSHIAHTVLSNPVVEQFRIESIQPIVSATPQEPTK